MRNSLLVLVLFLLPVCVWAQRGIISGKVQTAAGRPLELVTIGVKGTTLGTQTDGSGTYKLQVPADQDLELFVSYIGFKEQRRSFKVAASKVLEINFILHVDSLKLRTVDVKARRDEAIREQVSVTKLDPRLTKQLPSAFGEFNKILSTLPGVSSNNELSSSYSVRGGNFDENLVYVNGIEIYRPFLVTGAQQEGLSFVNPDLVGNIEFSSGGWQPKYGDKFSSVLNIEYKQPKEFAASVSGSLTGGTVHLEAASKNEKVGYLLGVRHKNGQYLLNSLQVEGDYRPAFSDAQAYLHFDLAKGPVPNGKTTLGILGSYAQNNFLVIPESRVTTFGTRQTPLRLYVGFDGREAMTYDTYQAGINLKHHFSAYLTSELILSGAYSREREFRDLEAGYRLCDLGVGNNYGECQQLMGAGSEFSHARNTLLAQIYTAESRNSWQVGPRSEFQFGLKAGNERIEDKLEEYGFADSADFVTSTYLLQSDLEINSMRYNAYVQHTYKLDSLKTLTYGIRTSYWSFNRELTVTPRLQYSFITRWNPDLSFKAAVGLYYQPPFYRELRNFDGELNPDLKAQRSVHYIIGSDYFFKAWERDFKLTSEVYYKQMTNVIPYDIDNVRLRYYSENNTKAYAAGFDVRVNGEFIKGAESWLSLGVLTTREDVAGDSVNVFNAEGENVGRAARGYTRRPTDQLVNVGVFFQDHLPNDPTMRVYLNLVYGSGLPFGPPRRPEYRNAFSGKSYKRIDLGFSKVLVMDKKEDSRFGMESLWLGLEVLNIIDANNRVSYTYVSDVNGVTYAIPNFLTGRRFNLRFIAKF